MSGPQFNRAEKLKLKCQQKAMPSRSKISYAAKPRKGQKLEAQDIYGDRECPRMGLVDSVNRVAQFMLTKHQNLITV